MRHPEIRDVCDLGQMIFWNQRWAFWFTAVMFILNNTFIMVRAANIPAFQKKKKHTLTKTRVFTASSAQNT
jgi:hypothetical protein